MGLRIIGLGVLSAIAAPPVIVQNLNSYLYLNQDFAIQFRSVGRYPWCTWEEDPRVDSEDNALPSSPRTNLEH